MVDYLSVTEISGDQVTQEQIHRLCNRYYWAGQYCQGKDVLEVACGTGQGLGYLSKLAKSMTAGDYSDEILHIARNHYGDRVDLEQFDAQDMPFKDNSFDIVIIFEAIYYLPNVDMFTAECYRVLRPGGKLLLATANKDLYDFTPSSYSYKYYGAVELTELLTTSGFQVELYGDTPLDKLSFRQKLLRPIKKIASSMNMIPESMEGKKFLKRIVFGKLVAMPAEIDDKTGHYKPPAVISGFQPDNDHKVIYCAATLTNK